ncbi:MAG: chromate resistance protein ChrB domain-containing protein [Acidobacteriota bacterium]
MDRNQRSWLLLLHQIPPQPAYFRAKVLRKLSQLGALAIKKSAYVLPMAEATLEDFQWVRREIEEEGGEAWLFHTDVIAGLSDESLREAFRILRKPDYDEQLEIGHRLLNELRSLPNNETAAYEAEWRKLKRRYEEVRDIDFFDAPGSKEMETIMNTIDHILHNPQKESKARPNIKDLKGRVWVTRLGVKVDRIASAWLIRRFIDPAAKFIFVDPHTYTHSNQEIRFDMFEGELTHEGDRCTFEVLIDLCDLKDSALRGVAEVVHDIDLKDNKYQRAEAAGVALIIDGIIKRHTDDMVRIEEGSKVFESLYASMGAENE